MATHNPNPSQSSQSVKTKHGGSENQEKRKRRNQQRATQANELLKELQQADSDKDAAKNNRLTAELMLRYTGWLYSTIDSTLIQKGIPTDRLSPQDKEEIVNSVFDKIVRNIRTYREGNTALAWMRTICRVLSTWYLTE